MYLIVCNSEACYSSERYLKYDLKKRVAVSVYYVLVFYTLYVYAMLFSCFNKVTIFSLCYYFRYIIVLISSCLGCAQLSQYR